MPVPLRLAFLLLVFCLSSSYRSLSFAGESLKPKFIYNCTQWVPYSPVDSSGGQAWKQITAAHQSGKLASGLAATYFTSPRPVYELYDLEADPSELNNLSGKPELREVEQQLRIALAEKMIVDFDYLPLPDLKQLAANDSAELAPRKQQRKQQPKASQPAVDREQKYARHRSSVPLLA